VTKTVNLFSYRFAVFDQLDSTEIEKRFVKIKNN